MMRSLKDPARTDGDPDREFPEDWCPNHLHHSRAQPEDAPARRVGCRGGRVVGVNPKESQSMFYGKRTTPGPYRSPRTTKPIFPS